MMNIYICDAGVMNVFVEYIDIWARYEDERVFSLVVAKSRGQAKSLFTSEHDLEFASYPISIRKVMSDIDIKQPFVAGSELWGQKKYSGLIDPYEDGCWAIICCKNLMGDNPEDIDPPDPKDCPYYEICNKHSKCRYEKPRVSTIIITRMRS